MSTRNGTRSLLIRGALIVAVLVAVTLFINLPWFDEPLHPELEAIRTPQPVSMEGNAYPLLYGFTADDGTDPRAAGLAVIRTLGDKFGRGESVTLSDDERTDILGDPDRDDSWRQ